MRYAFQAMWFLLYMTIRFWLLPMLAIASWSVVEILHHNHSAHQYSFSTYEALMITLSGALTAYWLRLMMAKKHGFRRKNAEDAILWVVYELPIVMWKNPEYAEIEALYMVTTVRLEMAREELIRKAHRDFTDTCMDWVTESKDDEVRVNMFLLATAHSNHLLGMLRQAERRSESYKNRFHIRMSPLFEMIHPILGSKNSQDLLRSQTITE